MVPFNWLAALAASFIPLIIGFIWYNPKVFGNAWVTAAGIDEEKMKGAKMGVIFLISFLFSVMLAFDMAALVIHQMHYYSILSGEPEFKDPNSQLWQETNAFMAKYGDKFRTFKHGAFHGLITSVFIILPVLGITALFERKGWKYIWINIGYWAICFMLMGAIVCGWR